MLKFIAPEIIYGMGAIAQVGDSARRLGATRVLVVSDPGVVAAGWTEQVLSNLREARLHYELFTTVTANVKDYEVERGALAYREAECDGVIGVGGGSALDAAKAIALLATNPGRIQDFEGVDRVSRPLPPMIMVPTTAGSGSEVTQFAVVKDTTRLVKMVLVSRSLIPDIALVDPVTLTTKEPELTAATGLDALTHAIESYTSVAATPLTESHALNAMRLVSKNLRSSVARSSDLEAKSAMAMASLMAGLAFSNAILGAVHAMSHSLGGRLDLPHGEACAILLPHVMEFNLLACVDRYAEVARAMGQPVEGLSRRAQAEQAIDAVVELVADLGINRSLSALGITQDVIPSLADLASRDVCLATNPRDARPNELRALFNAAW